MWSKIKHLIRYIRYYLKARTHRGIHSPLAFDFIQNTLEDKRSFYAFKELDVLRAHLRSDKRTINYIDFGAGSYKTLPQKRQVRDIALTSVSGKFFSELLFKIAHWLKPEYVLEIGSSLGLSTSYLARGHPFYKFITLEGAPEVAHLAHHVLADHAPGVELKVGRFEETLAPALQELGRLDLAFIDGNHTYEATLSYFSQCLEKCHDGSVLIFDDIHWSKGMENAWCEIKRHKDVRLSIDLFFMGIVFFRKDIKEEVHLSVIAQKFKPLYWGIF